jgi:hypothetical protein
MHFRLGRRRGSPELRDTEGIPHVILDGWRKLQEIALGRSYPVQRSLTGGRDASHTSLSQFWDNLPSEPKRFW